MSVRSFLTSREGRKVEAFPLCLARGENGPRALALPRSRERKQKEGKTEEGRKKPHSPRPEFRRKSGRHRSVKRLCLFFSFLVFLLLFSLFLPPSRLPFRTPLTMKKTKTERAMSCSRLLGLRLSVGLSLSASGPTRHSRGQTLQTQGCSYRHVRARVSTCTWWVYVQHVSGWYGSGGLVFILSPREGKNTTQDLIQRTSF